MQPSDSHFLYTATDFGAVSSTTYCFHHMIAVQVIIHPMATLFCPPHTFCVKTVKTFVTH